VSVPWSAGFDIGGASVKCGALLTGAPPAPSRSIPTQATQGPEALVSRIAASLRAETEKRGAAPLAIGVGCAGLIDPARGVVVTSPNLPGWEGTELRGRLENAVGRSITLVNDANAFVLAESRVGAARGRQTVCGLAIGTGVGGGFVADGTLWLGAHGFAGEFGHWPFALDGPRCACGQIGCLEAFIGTPAIVGAYLAASDEVATPEEIARRAGGGDAMALAVFAELGRILGTALAGLTALFDPEIFVVGGGVAQAEAYFLPQARAALRARALAPPDALPDLVAAALGPDAGWIGAALLAEDRG